MAHSQNDHLRPVRTFKEVGDAMGISADRAWQLEKSAFQKIRKHLMKVLGPEYFGVSPEEVKP